jgi:hypothetical protein
MVQRSARIPISLACSMLLFAAGCGSSARKGPPGDAARGEDERGSADGGGGTGLASPGDGGRGYDLAEPDIAALTDAARQDGGDLAVGADGGPPNADADAVDPGPGALDAADASRLDEGNKNDGAPTGDGAAAGGQDDGWAEEAGPSLGEPEAGRADGGIPADGDGGSLGSDGGDDGGVDAGPRPGGWVVAGRWPSYGYAAAQTRTKVVPTAFPAANPTLAWTLTLPVARHTMFYSSATSGPDGTLYIPFFGIWDNYPAGGIQAVSASGEPLWYFAARETEAQSPLIAQDQATGDTVVIFGSAGRPYGTMLAPDPGHHFASVMAIYDRPGCRCCVDREAAASSCEFACVADELCQPYDPQSRYEWRHTGHVDPNTRQATCGQVNPQCAAWILSTDGLDPARVPPSPAIGYYEESTTPLLAPDGRTVYYSICGVDLLVDLTNLIVAMDVTTKAAKWILTEDDPQGWDQGECLTGHNQLGWITSSAVFSDGSLLYGTRSGCLVRIVDHGDHGAVEGMYRGAHPSAVGLALERTGSGDDQIYVSTHGQVRQQPGDLYLTARSRLTAQGTGHQPIWTWAVGKAIAPDDWNSDGPGLFGSPALVPTETGTVIYAVAGDWPDQGTNSWLNPDRGWLVRVPASGPDGSEKVLPLELEQQWFPAINCTVDGSGALWLHGGLDRAVAGGGRILRAEGDLSALTAITAGTTERLGCSEVLLDGDGLIAISAASWDGDDNIFPVVYRFGGSPGR